jgi:hypothetical protein
MADPEDMTKTSTGPLGFARMTGSSIAGRDAAAWVTDFLNAAYYRRAAEDREVDDLRLAFCILTTYWHRNGKLHLDDLRAFHRAFGQARFESRGTLDREALLEGGAKLLGDWFPSAYETRRGWGIAFESDKERENHVPERRLELAKLGPLTPESAPPSEQVWLTYQPVEMPSAEGVIAALTRPETWPDYASEIGRFTPLRSCGLLGQTFEIDVAAGVDVGRPVFTRGYVTITALVTPEDPAALREWFDAVLKSLPEALPYGAEPLVGFDLTTHEGHFMGAGHNRLLLYKHLGKIWVRAAGTWDPMPWHLDQAYRRAGAAAQHAFWGEGEVRQSMLHQLALAVT